jgi:hypothetical protein
MRNSLVALFLFAASLSPLAADALSDGLRADPARERRRLVADTRNLAETTRRLESALAQVSSGARSVADGSSRSDIGADEVARREDALTGFEQEARMLLERRRILADRVVERRRSIALLEAELATRKAPDALSGPWTILLDPGEQKGVFRMTLDGTIVAGEYSLEGGYSGSLRGTLINDRLKIERVDSKLGFSAVYYGRLARDGRSITGTWQATTFGTGTPGSGRWSAVREEPTAEETP